MVVRCHGSFLPGFLMQLQYIHTLQKLNSEHHYMVVVVVAIVSHKPHYVVASDVCGNCQSFYMVARDVCGNCQSLHGSQWCLWQLSVTNITIYLVVMFVAIVSHEHHYIPGSGCLSQLSVMNITIYLVVKFVAIVVTDNNCHKHHVQFHHLISTVKTTVSSACLQPG